MADPFERRRQGARGGEEGELSLDLPNGFDAKPIPVQNETLVLHQRGVSSTAQRTTKAYSKGYPS